MSGKDVNGSEPPQGGPLIRVVVEVRGGRVAVQGNAPWQVMVNVLKDAIVALAQHAVKEESKSLVKPVSSVPPGLLPGPGSRLPPG